MCLEISRMIFASLSHSTFIILVFIMGLHSHSPTVLKPVPRFLCKRGNVSPIRVVKFHGFGALKISPLRAVNHCSACQVRTFTSEWSIMTTASSSTGVQLAPNSVRSLQLNPFERRTLAEKLIVK